MAIRGFRKSSCSVLLLVCAVAAQASSDQVWLSQGAAVNATDTLRFSFSNTIYMEHGEHFANEEAFSARWKVADHWAVGGGASHSQDRVLKERGNPPDDVSLHHHWDWSGRATEHLAVDWFCSVGNWNLQDAHRIYMYFRSGERDWAVYRNIVTVTAPPVPYLPWSPRPYFTQFLYVSSRDCYDGLDRFSQFRSIAGMKMKPLDGLLLSTYWQYRDIEEPSRDWVHVRIFGISASLDF